MPVNECRRWHPHVLVCLYVQEYASLHTSFQGSSAGLSCIVCCLGLVRLLPIGKNCEGRGTESFPLRWYLNQNKSFSYGTLLSRRPTWDPETLRSVLEKWNQGRSYLGEVGPPEVNPGKAGPLGARA